MSRPTFQHRALPINKNTEDWARNEERYRAEVERAFQRGDIALRDIASELRDSDTSSYHDPTGVASWRIVGDTLECWGEDTSGAASPVTITLPKTFDGLYVVTATPSTTLQRIAVVTNKLASSFDVYRFFTSTTDLASAINFQWHAIGKWDGTS